MINGLERKGERKKKQLVTPFSTICGFGTIPASQVAQSPQLGQPVTDPGRSRGARLRCPESGADRGSVLPRKPRRDTDPCRPGPAAR